jgi:hypothetical protein
MKKKKREVGGSEGHNIVVNIKNAVLLVIKTHLVPHRNHYLSATGSSLLMPVRFKVFMVVTMKNIVFWDDCCNNQRFGGTNRLYHQGEKHQWYRKNVISN